ncbi:MAG: nucleotidyltransferase family protein [Defluviitaleaceae bacterium]|nr:nucleotidyltransferase family protein [Defluviitaleaceae bacterium]
MDKTCGIIAEYNPFHNGHAYQISAARHICNSQNVIVILSGNFVQRGEPAVINKFARTKQALLSGADLVLELPADFAMSSAEGFAQGAVSILDASGIVTDICFGAENPDISALKYIAKFLANETDEFKQILRHHLSMGDNFPKARAKAISSAMINNENFEDIIKSPNNILGIEYLKAIEKIGAGITPHAIARKGASHHSKKLVPPYASASALRNEILGGNIDIIADFVPLSSYKILQHEHLHGAINFVDNLSPYFHYALATKKTKTIFDKTAKSYYNISDIINATKTKNVTHAALKRAAIQVLLNTKKSEQPQYIRVLGFKRQKQNLVSLLHKKSSLPVVTNLKDINNLPQSAKEMLEFELWASNLWWLGLKHKNIHAPNEFSTPMVIV